MPLLPAVRAVRTKLLPGIAARGVLRRMQRTDAGRDPRDFFDGQIVRLRGRVVDDGLARTATGHPDAVVCRQSVRDALGGLLSEGTLAHDFDLRLHTGDTIRVQIATATGLRALIVLDEAEDHREGRGLARGWSANRGCARVTKSRPWAPCCARSIRGRRRRGSVGRRYAGL
jgi:hypothetical protein